MFFLEGFYVFVNPLKLFLLSSMHVTGTVNQNTQKPDIIDFYNLTKGGVDVFDKLCHSYSAKRASRRWPMRYFFGVLDAAGINTFVLHRLNNNSGNRTIRSDFLKSLEFSLEEPFMKLRMNNTKLPKTVRTEIRTVLGLPESLEAAPTPPCRGRSATRTRCHLCKNDRKTYNSCDICALPIRRQRKN